MNFIEENEINQKERIIELDEIEAKRRLGSQLTKYLGSKDKVKVFAGECKQVGLNLGDINVIKNIANEPEWFSVLLSYSELGLLPRLGDAIMALKKNNETTK